MEQQLSEATVSQSREREQFDQMQAEAQQKAQHDQEQLRVQMEEEHEAKLRLCVEQTEALHAQAMEELREQYAEEVSAREVEYSNKLQSLQQEQHASEGLAAQKLADRERVLKAEALEIKRLAEVAMAEAEISREKQWQQKLSAFLARAEAEKRQMERERAKEVVVRSWR